MNTQANKSAGTAKDADVIIGRMARLGKLMEIGKRAIIQTHRLGFAATVVENGEIVQLYPDGTKKIIGKAAIASGRKYLTGKRKLR